MPPCATEPLIEMVSARASSTIHELAARARRYAFGSPIVARLSSRVHCVVLGDSHAAVFENWRPRGWWFDVTSVGGATASGIRNPNSQTDALGRFRARLSVAGDWQTVLLLLGEVDCGYVIWRRMRSRGEDADTVLDETISRYETFIGTEVALPGRQVIVLSAPLPTLPDDSSTWGEVAQRRADVQVSQADRTTMTLRFNELLATVCRGRGWRFVDAATPQLDPETGLIRADLVRTGTGDHHLNDEPFRAILAGRLAPR